MVTDVKLLQQAKALYPMEVTELGMVTEVKLLHEEKAQPPIDVTLYIVPLQETDSGMTMSPE